MHIHIYIYKPYLKGLLYKENLQETMFFPLNMEVSGLNFPVITNPMNYIKWLIMVSLYHYDYITNVAHATHLGMVYRCLHHL